MMPSLQLSLRPLRISGRPWSARPAAGRATDDARQRAVGDALRMATRPAWRRTWVAAGIAGAAIVAFASVARADEPGNLPLIEGGLSAVGQRVNAGGSDDGRARGRLGYRADLGATLGAPAPAGGTGEVVLHLRFGQGEGVGVRPTYTGAVNSLAFATPDGDAHGELVQAYYSLRFEGDDDGRGWALHAGKLDPFGFFDQNAIADDESAGFLNNVFVHNPLLDSGGDIGADEFGFTPGLVVQWGVRSSDRRAWGLSAGVFASGDGADFSGSPRKPWFLAQAETSRLDGAGEATGTWRLLAWTNPRAEDFDGRTARHSGMGVSADERLLDDLTGFARLGLRFEGRGAFDRAVTAGVEWRGPRWGRDDDALGLAVGALETDADYRRATADGTLAGYAASGRETSVEVFYRYSLAEGLHLTPSVQWVRRPGGDPSADTVRVIGLRATLAF